MLENVNIAINFQFLCVYTHNLAYEEKGEDKKRFFKKGQEEADGGRTSPVEASRTGTVCCLLGGGI